MPYTDGYITNEAQGDWRTANTGVSSSDQLEPLYYPTYVRLEHPEAPLAGTRVNGVGDISTGPAVDFTDPAGLLTGAPSEPGSRPFIVWAGVSPLSLREGLIVWNTNIVLLNTSKVTGGDVKSVTGRLMVLDLGDPIEITGLERRSITIDAGAVGFYRPDNPDIDACDEDLIPPLTASDEETEETEGEDPLVDPTEPEPTCECGEVVFGDPVASEPASDGPQLQALVFSTLCNPSAQCGDIVEGNHAAFVVNNPLVVPLRCTHPFYLERCYTGFGTCPCDQSCERDARVWEVAMELYGGTLPGEIFPLDQLQQINPCYIGLQNFADGYPATLREAVACAVPCPLVNVEIVGRFGPPVQEDGRWEHGNPGYQGQQALYLPPCFEVCNISCQARVLPDLADCFVAEDIIKPVQRTVPVSFFEDWIITAQKVTIYDTQTIGLREVGITGLTNIQPAKITTYEPIAQTIKDWNVESPQTAISAGTAVVAAAATVVTQSGNVVGAISLNEVLVQPPIEGRSVPQVITAGGSHPLPYATALNLGPVRTFLSALATTILVNPKYATITACVNGEVLALQVVTTIASVAALSQTIPNVVGLAADTQSVITELAGEPLEVLQTAPLAGITVTEVPSATPSAVVTNITVTPVNITGLVTPSYVTVTGVTPLDDITFNVFNLASQSIANAIVNYDEVQHDVVVRDDVAGDSFAVLDTSKPTVYDALVADEQGDITLITTTEPGCPVKYKFLNHDGPISWTSTQQSAGNCCNSPAVCTPSVEIHPVEMNCEHLLLLRGNYVSAPSSPTRDTCPCYDCSPETCEEDGGGPFEVQGSGPNPCTLRVRRLNRRFCVNRDCNPGP